ncbi:fused MFS/spermidine synthase [Stappia stellulata]|uniref:fused MFS/spermidine synthase n=1 Tax=Stappia stellulata TaxID=71235 RepID=UPI00068763AD|nr:fused MFS/spermidine synthase [Stappia stellulata]
MTTDTLSPTTSGTAAAGNTVPLWFLLGAQFLVAAAGLVVEIVAGRMLAPYVGMSLYTWTAVIAVVLAGFSAGHWIGGLVADRPQRTALAWLAISGALGALTTLAALPLIRLVSAPVLSAVPGPIGGIVALTGLLFFLPSFAAGIPSPILARLAIEDRARSGRALGALHALSAIGAIAGTLSAGYLFISWIGTIWTLVVVAAAYAAFALACLAMLRGHAGRERAGRDIVSAATALTLFALATLAATPFTPASACTVESRYYCIRSIDVSADVGAPARLMVLDHLGHGLNVLGEPTRLEMPYAATIDAIARARLDGSPERAFFIGGGALTLPRAWSADGIRPGLVAAEIDPEVTRVARADFDVDTSRFTITHADARVALSGLDRFQVVVGDAFTDIAVPAHLVTREFYEEIAHSLDPDGFYLMNLIDHSDSLRALAASVRTLKTVFPVVEAWVEAEDFSSGGRTTFVLMAGDSPSPTGRMALASTAPGAPNRIIGRIPPARVTALVETLDPPVLTDDYAPIDRLIGARP